MKAMSSEYQRGLKGAEGTNAVVVGPVEEYVAQACQQERSHSKAQRGGMAGGSLRGCDATAKPLTVTARATRGAPRKVWVNPR